jgi:hypothetical protein
VRSKFSICTERLLRAFYFLSEEDDAAAGAVAGAAGVATGALSLPEFESVLGFESVPDLASPLDDLLASLEDFGFALP